MPGLTRMSSISAGRTIVVCADTTTALDSHRRATDPIAALSQPRQRFTMCTRPPGRLLLQPMRNLVAIIHQTRPPLGVRRAGCGVQGGVGTDCRDGMNPLDCRLRAISWSDALLDDQQRSRTRLV